MGEQRLVDLSVMTSVEASTLSRLADTMQEARLIAKVRSKKNRRELLLTIAPRGKELAETLAPVASAYESRLTRGLSTSELAITRHTLRHMFTQLSELKEVARDSRQTRRQTPVLAKNLLRTRALCVSSSPALVGANLILCTRKPFSTEARRTRSG
jgi:DNA-binding MarR family transcriptional regulator